MYAASFGLLLVMNENSPSLDFFCLRWFKTVRRVWSCPFSPPAAQATCTNPFSPSWSPVGYMALTFAHMIKRRCPSCHLCMPCLRLEAPFFGAFLGLPSLLRSLPNPGASMAPQPAHPFDPPSRHSHDPFLGRHPALRSLLRYAWGDPRRHTPSGVQRHTPRRPWPAHSFAGTPPS